MQNLIEESNRVINLKIIKLKKNTCIVKNENWIKCFIEQSKFAFEGIKNLYCFCK